MFDIIGKRRWFFAFSLLITLPGLIAILLGPISGGKQGLDVPFHALLPIEESLAIALTPRAKTGWSTCVT